MLENENGGLVEPDHDGSGVMAGLEAQVTELSVETAAIPLLDRISLGSSWPEVQIDGTQVQLSPKLYDLLSLFIENINRVVERDDIWDRVWGRDWFLTRHSKTLDVHISELRKTLGSDLRRHLVTVRGVGYQLIGQLSPDESTDLESQASTED